MTFFVRWNFLSATAGCAFLLLTSTAVGQEAPKNPTVPKYASFAESKEVFDRVVAPVFAKHCKSCHNGRTAEGDLDLSKLDPDMKESSSAGRWAMLKKLVANREMPPEDRPKLSDEDVKGVTLWITAEMKRSGKHFAVREAFANGNKVSHEKLFDPEFKAKFDNPSQLRRLTPEIYAAEVIGSHKSIGQAFTAEGRNLFKDMGAPKLDEPTTSLLIRNAKRLATIQTEFKIEDGKFKGSMPKEFANVLDESIPLDDANITAAIKTQFSKVLSRAPTPDELERVMGLMKQTIKDASRVVGVRTALASIYLLPEAIYRWELGSGPIDEQGRVRLSPREIAYAISYTLTNKRPSPALLAAAEQGALNTQEGVAAEVRRLLDDPKTPKPRILRFFREYFGYDKAREVFQDEKAAADHDPKALIEDTDRLIEYILEQDKNVFRELFTTNKAFVGYKSAADLKKKRAEAIAQFEAGKLKEPEKFKNKKLQLPGKGIYLAYNLLDFPDTQPVELPREERAGILTQPSWLASYAKTGENHAIFRGKWVRERLLGGIVPDVPITVDAQLPNAPHHTLRERMKVTQEDYCWKCHIFMNPVGLPFEVFDYFGRYRKDEPVLDEDATAKNVDKKGKNLGTVMKAIPVDSSGSITDFGDPKAEGKVTDALEMIRKIAESERAEQLFVRHVFRYFTGRNENLGDGPSLRYAHNAYREGGGSMKALLAALFSSDSFLYRVPSARDAKTEN